MTADTFTRWLRRQRDRRDAVGDLARDQRYDSCWPRGRARLDTLRRHLEHDHDACEGATDALDSAWAQWHTARERPEQLGEDGAA